MAVLSLSDPLFFGLRVSQRCPRGVSSEDSFLLLTPREAQNLGYSTLGTPLGGGILVILPSGHLWEEEPWLFYPREVQESRLFLTAGEQESRLFLTARVGVPGKTA